MTLIDKYKLPSVAIRKEDLLERAQGLTLLEAYTLWTNLSKDHAKQKNMAREHGVNAEWPVRSHQ